MPASAPTRERLPASLLIFLLVTLDLVGYFNNEIQTARSLVDPARGIESITVTSTHNHEGPDTMGLWGPDQTTTGADLGYLDFVNEQIAGCIHDADDALDPVGELDRLDPPLDDREERTFGALVRGVLPRHEADVRRSPRQPLALLGAEPGEDRDRADLVPGDHAATLPRARLSRPARL